MPAKSRVWKQLALAAAAIALLLLVTYGFLAARFWTGEPTLTRNFRQELAAQAEQVPAEQRAWPVYREALLALPVYPEIDGIRWLGRRWPHVDAEDPEYPLIVEYLRQAAPALAVVRRAAAFEHLGFAGSLEPDHELSRNRMRLSGRDPSESVPDEAPGPDNPPLLELYSPPLPILSDFKELLQSDADLALLDQDGERWSANIIAMLGITRQHVADWGMGSQLVSYTFAQRTFARLRKALRDAPELVSDAHLEALAREVARTPVAGRVLPRTQVHRMFFDDALQRIYTDDGQGSGRLTPQGVLILHEMDALPAEVSQLSTRIEVAQALAPIMSHLMANRREMLSEYERLEAIINTRGIPHAWERLPNTDTLAEIDTLTADKAWQSRYPLASYWAPIDGMSLWRADTATAERDATLCIIAMHRFQRSQGRWPASLEELVPQFLAEVPRDLYTGEPLRYRPPANPSEGPTLYSVGSNLRDDGGIFRPEESGRPPGMGGSEGPGDWVLWPVHDQPWD